MRQNNGEIRMRYHAGNITIWSCPLRCSCYSSPTIYVDAEGMNPWIPRNKQGKYIRYALKKLGLLKETLHTEKFLMPLDMGNVFKGTR